MTAAAPAAAPVVIEFTDGGFDDTAADAGFASWAYGPASAVWQLGGVGTPVIYGSMYQGDAIWGVDTSAVDGQAFLGLRGDGGAATMVLASRTLPGLTPGATYTVSWYQTHRNNWNAPYYSDIRVAVSGRLLYMNDSVPYATAPFSATWTRVTSAVFVASSSSPTLALFGTDPQNTDSTVFVDSISVTQVSAAPALLFGVPLPIPNGGFEVYATRAVGQGAVTALTRRTFALGALASLGTMSTPTVAANIPETISNQWTFSPNAGVQHTCSIAAVAACGTQVFTSTWGGLPAGEGKMYATLKQGVAGSPTSMNITLTGLVPGKFYQLTWLQNALPTTAPFAGALVAPAGNIGDGNNLNVWVRRRPTEATSSERSGRA